MLKKVFTIVGLAALSVSAQTPTPLPDGDLVKELAQFTNISFGLYSGYITLSKTKKDLHYIAALSQNDYKNDPVIVQLNGERGCSALVSFGFENGPYLHEDNSHDFSPNPHSWNKNATVIYLDAIAGVGFS